MSALQHAGEARAHGHSGKHSAAHSGETQGLKVTKQDNVTRGGPGLEAAMQARGSTPWTTACATLSSQAWSHACRTSQREL